MSTTNQSALDSLISAASARGDRHGNDAQIDALESLVIAAWSMMTDEQTAALLNSDACSDLLPQGCDFSEGCDSASFSP